MSPTSVARRARWFLALVALTPWAAMSQCPSCLQIARTFARQEHFNGVVLVGHGGKIDYTESFGVADLGTGRRLTADTPFEAGSISKWIASVVVMRLVQEGRLSLDEPITSYLPDYRRDTGSKLTLRWLMSHSSGVPNQIDEAVKADPSVKRLSLDNATAVRRYASGDLRFEPGTDWDYSHSNWLIVKAIVEKVAARPYAELVRTYVTSPLALRHSGTWVGDSAQIRGMALGYASWDERPVQRVNPVPDFLVLAGGFHASAKDMFHFMEGLFSGKVIAPTMTTTLMAVNRPDQDYALGGRTKTLDIAGALRPVAWEYGSNGAFRMLAWRVLADGHTVIVMNNTSFDHMKIGDLATRLMDASYK